MHPELKSLRDGAPPRFDRLRDALRGALPLLDALAETPQDPEWHAEGDVATHTAWVLREAHGRASDLAPPARLTLLLAALLHDIAKPLTTRERVIDGRARIVAPRHPQRGRDWLSYRLLDLGLPYDVLLEVLRLVETHHEPKKLVLKDRDVRAYVALSRRVSMTLLHHLALADMRGRDCVDKPTQLDLIELFRLYCRDHGLFSPSRAPWRRWRAQLTEALDGAPPEHLEYTLSAAARDLDAGRISTPEEALARSFEARRDGLGGVTVLFGPSGAGKSRWCATQEASVISLDALRETIAGDASSQKRNGQVRQRARELLREALRAKRPVIWDATCLRRDMRQAVIDLARDYRAHTTLVVFHVPIDQLHARNSARLGRKVPVGVLDRQIDRLEWPDEQEADRTLYIDVDGATLRDTRRAP